jgi:exonuclease III
VLRDKVSELLLLLGIRLAFDALEVLGFVADLVTVPRRPYLDEAGAIDATAHYMDAIEQIGFHDLWRHRYPDRREYSWFSTRNNGFRIDHAFLSQELAACAGTVHYSHEERIAGISDHSPLILELTA